MMQWRASAALFALVLIPLLAAFFVWAFKRRERDLARFIETTLQPVVADFDPRRRRLRVFLLSAAVACLVLAIAGPMWGFHWQEVRSEGIDLVVAIDTSKSMLASDVAPNRLARAKLAVHDLANELRGDRVALVAFAGTAFLQSPLTLDRAAFRESLDAIDIGIIPRGGTNLAAALETSLAAFDGRQGSHQAVVLITDGEALEGTAADAVKLAAERGVRVFTVGIGTAEGELIPMESGGYLKDRKGQVVKSRLDEQGLQKIAIDTGGVYLHAGGTDFGLAELYREHIATMEKRELESRMEKRYEHRFQIPLLAALILLVAEALLAEQRRKSAAAGRGREIA
jgi:Ca-activated chloride channel family protein